MISSDQKICVLIPAYNEEKVLGGTIEAIERAQINLRDVFIVDDRSTDKTAEIARDLGVNVFTVPENGGKARAQTQALEHFNLCERYEWIIFLDGDTKIDPNFYSAMREAVKEDSSVALFVGQVKSVKNNHAFSAARAVDYAFGQDIARQGQSNFNVITVAPGCASMYRTDALRQLKIDPMTLAEDMDLTIQLLRLGHKAKYISDAVVYTQDPNNLKDYSKQMLRWYRGLWQVTIKHGLFKWQRKQRVDIYLLLCVLDGLIFNRMLWLVGLTIAFPNMILSLLSIDLIIAFLVVCYGSYRSSRLDPLKKFPKVYVIGHLTTYYFIRSFIEIIVLRKEMLAWNKVKRYDFNDSHK